MLIYTRLGLLMSFLHDLDYEGGAMPNFVAGRDSSHVGHKARPMPPALLVNRHVL